jgi:hypothetical protein
MRLGRVLAWGVLVLAVIYAGLVSALYLAQDRLLYPAAGQPVASITADVAGFEALASGLGGSLFQPAIRSRSSASAPRVASPFSTASRSGCNAVSGFL